jgi:DNA primase
MKNGQSWRTTCPIHQGTNPTAFSIDLVTGLYHCFVCRASGILLDYLYGEQTKFLTILQNLENITETASSLRTTNFKASKQKQSLNHKVASRKPTTNAASLERLVALLKMSQNNLNMGNGYLAARGISLSTARSMGLGFHSQWRFFAANKRPPRLPNEIKKEDKNQYFSVATHPAIIFPTYGASGFVNLYARSTTPNQRLHHVPSGQKGIFNYKSFERATSNEPVILVEGCFDALAMIEAGYPNAAALIGLGLGANTLSWYEQLLAGNPANLILAFDNDEAGYLATQRIANQFYQTLGILPYYLPANLWRNYNDFSSFWQDYGQPRHLKIDWKAVIQRCQPCTLS